MISPFCKGMITYPATSIKIKGTQIIINVKRDWAAAWSHMQSTGLQIFLIKELTLSCLTPHWLQVNY